MPRASRPFLLRTTTAQLVVAGATGLATVLAVAPVAVADDAPAPGTTTTDGTTTPAPTDSAPSPTDPTPTPTDATPGPADQAPAKADATPGATADLPAKVDTSVNAAKAAVKPDFGYTKFRVGVQLASGSFVPSSTSTLGSTITIVETGPGVTGGTLTTTCTTTAGPAAPNGVSTCENLNTSGDPFSQDYYIAAEGDVVTVTQTTVNAGLVISDGTKTVVPVPVCNEVQCNNLGDVILTDAGLPPKAVNDSATTDPGKAVSINVLKNDDTVNGAPLTDIHVTSDPGHGTTTITGSGAVRRIRYTPDANFSGTDTFHYSISTANGTATATVTVTVRAPKPPAAVPAPKPPAADAVLPDTGGPDAGILGLGLILVAGGGWLTAQGRRLRRTDALR